MVPNGKGKDHETLFVPHVHPTTLDDLEAGYTGDKQSDNDKGARSKKVLLGGVFCVVVLMCCGAICLSGSQEQVVSSTRWSLEALVDWVGGLIDNTSGGQTSGGHAAEPLKHDPDWNVIQLDREQRILLDLSVEDVYQGYGTQAVVFKAMFVDSWNRPTGKDAAVKVSIISNEHPEWAIREGLEANCKIAQLHMNNPAVSQFACKVYGIGTLSPGLRREAARKIGNDVWPEVVIMEYCSNGDLEKYLEREGCNGTKRQMSINTCATWVWDQVTSPASKSPAQHGVWDLEKAARHLGHGLYMLHEHGVALRDVKAANILVRKDGCPVFADFDCVTQATWKSGEHFRGTPAYMPPEAFDWENPSRRLLHPKRQDYFGLMLILLYSAGPATKLELRAELETYLKKSKTENPSDRFRQILLSKVQIATNPIIGLVANMLNELFDESPPLLVQLEELILVKVGTPSAAEEWCSRVKKWLAGPRQAERQCSDFSNSHAPSSGPSAGSLHGSSENEVHACGEFATVPHELPPEVHACGEFATVRHEVRIRERESSPPPPPPPPPSSPKKRDPIPFPSPAAPSSMPLHAAPNTQIYPAPTTQMHPLCAAAPAYGHGLGVYQHAYESMYPHASAPANVSTGMAYCAQTQHVLVQQQHQMLAQQQGWAAAQHQQMMQQWAAAQHQEMVAQQQHRRPTYAAHAFALRPQVLIWS